MKAILLAAGYATRLYPLTNNKPKPLLEVAGKPIIEHIISKISQIREVDKIFVVTNDKFFKNFQQWLDDFSSDKQIKIVNDNTLSNEDRLGAIGDINFVIEKEKIDDDLLVVAGDNLFEFSLADVVKLFKTKKSPAIALYDVKSRELAKKYGIVTIDPANKIIRFVEKPEKPESTLSSTGVYLYPKDTLNMISSYLGEGGSQDKTGSFLEWLYKRKDIYCYISKERWYDIGSFEELERARNEYNGE